MGHIDERYDRDKRAVLGGGTYATVYAAKCKRTGEMVALKKLRRMAPASLPTAATCATQRRVGGAGGSCGPGGGPGGPAGLQPFLSKGVSPPPFTFHAGEPGWVGWAATAGVPGCRFEEDDEGPRAVTERGDGTADDRGGVTQAALREIKVLKELRHPHIVRLRETFQHKQTLVLVFDYAAGGDLELLLYPPDAGNGVDTAPGRGGGMFGRNGGGGGGGGSRIGSVCGMGNGGSSGSNDGEVARSPLPAGVIKAHMKALLEALAYCHEQGVLHRDVKPNNLLLDGQGRLLLADFGLARYLPLEPNGEEAEDGSVQATGEEAGGRSGRAAGGKVVAASAVAGTEDRRICLIGGSGGLERGSSQLMPVKQVPGKFGKTSGDGGAGESSDTREGLGRRAGCAAGGGDGAGPVDRPAGPLTLHETGLSRGDYAQPLMTHQVGMRWYRPPELLFGCRTYGSAVDIWAAGCVFAEMVSGRVWFKGNSDMDQLHIIFEVLGSPSEDSWPGVTRLPNYLKFTATPPKDLTTIFPNATPDALDLLSHLARLCPEQRLTARQALSHPYFTSNPPPTPPGQLPLATMRTAAVAAVATNAAALAASRHIWGSAAAAATISDIAMLTGPFHLFGHRTSSRTESYCAGGREAGGHGNMPVFRVPRGQSHGAAELALPRFHLPLPPQLPSGRMQAVRMSFDGASARQYGAGEILTSHNLPVAHGFRLGQRLSLDFPDLPSSGALPGLFFPLTGSGAASDVAAMGATTAAATGGGGDGQPALGLSYLQPSARVLLLRPQGHPSAVLEDDGDGHDSGEIMVHASSSAPPYDTALPQQHRQAGRLHAGAPTSLAADAAASAPRRFRRGRRTRSSIATPGMSISEMSVAVLEMEGDVTRPDAAEEDTKKNKAMLEGAIGQQTEGLMSVGGGDAAEQHELAADEEGEEEHLDGAEEEAEEHQDIVADVEGEEEEEEDFDGFRRCVARRFSFGSSLATEGDGTAAAAVATFATAAETVARGRGGEAMATTVVSDGAGGTGVTSHNKDEAVPMTITTTMTAAAAYSCDPMCISVSICGGGGGGGGGGPETVGSKRPRPLRDTSNQQQLPPTPSTLPSSLAGAEHPGNRSSGHSYFQQVQPGSDSGGKGGSGGADVCMHEGSTGSGVSVGAGVSGGGGGSGGSGAATAAAAAPAASVAPAPSCTMVSASAASASVNEMAGPEVSLGSAAVRGLMEAPPPRIRQSRTSDVTVAMSLSFAVGLDGVVATNAPPTAMGPRQQIGMFTFEQPSVHGPQASAVMGGRSGGDANATALLGVPLLPPVVTRVPAATADVGVIAAANAAAAAGGGDGGDASRCMVVAAAAALSDSVHLRPGPSGVRPDSTDLQYLRQRKVEVDEALRQASHSGDPPALDDKPSELQGGLQLLEEEDEEAERQDDDLQGLWQ